MWLKIVFFCHLVAALGPLRGGRHMSSGLCVCLTKSLCFLQRTTWNRNSAVLTLWAPAVQAAEHLHSECLPSHSTEWNFTLGETTTRRATGFPMTPLAITKKTLPHIQGCCWYLRGWWNRDFPFSFVATLSYLGLSARPCELFSKWYCNIWKLSVMFRFKNVHKCKHPPSRLQQEVTLTFM